MQESEVLVRRFYDDLWNRADARVAWEILHEDFAFRASLGPVRTGPQGFIDYMLAIHRALEGYVCIIESVVATERHAAARMLFRGTHRGRFFEVEPTGREVTWAGAAFFETDREKIMSLWVLGDIDAVKRQLGATADFAG